MGVLPKWKILINNEYIDFMPTTEVYGFVYEITYSDNTKYCGKKNAWVREELPPLKSGKTRDTCIDTINRIYNGKRVTMEITQKPSDWRRYTGSSKLTKGKTIISRTVLATAQSKRHLTYLETKYLFSLGVLEDDTYVNENILGKFFKFNLV